MNSETVGRTAEIAVLLALRMIGKQCISCMFAHQYHKHSYTHTHN